MLSMYLRRIDSFEVETAAHGLAAWELIAQDPARFDVVITDNQMPHLDGIGLVEKLRASGFPGRIIFFSSTIAPQGAERVSRLGVDAVIEKGRPISELMTAIRHALSG
jgi:DNA-binding NarL/FixJ family response regulator